MEVHRHSHYFWEFLMLFFAVFCGFLAEYQLEQTIERHREKEFILSMIEDAATDTANIHACVKANEERIKYADSLAEVCFNYRGTQEERTQMYNSYNGCVYRPDLLYPIDRTLFQLKNSGGMRLIRNKEAANIIIGYDKSGKSLVNQQAYYEMYLTNVTSHCSQMMNVLLLANKTIPVSQKYANVQLINDDRTALKVLANQAIMFKGVMNMYVIRLNQMEATAVLLIETLRKEYHLK
jgi:hypothetical protein